MKSKIELTGYEMLEKKVKKSGHTDRIYLPVEWINKRVKIILLEK